jgi:c-di-GMP phosphodiesterase
MLDSSLRLKVLVGRQPIFDSRKRVFGYELLYRSSEVNAANVLDGEEATRDVLLSAMVHLGLDQLVGGSYAFVNMTRKFLSNNSLLLDLPKRVVLEVLEDIVPDRLLIDRVKKLSQRGFKIALDDFGLDSLLTPLLPVADIVKVDLPEIPPTELAGHVAAIRRYPVKLLAEKVETAEEFERCKELGFDLFQGYFLARPEIVKGQKLTPSQITTIELLSKINDPNVELEDLDALIKTDAALSH